MGSSKPRHNRLKINLFSPCTSVHTVLSMYVSVNTKKNSEKEENVSVITEIVFLTPLLSVFKHSTLCTGAKGSVFTSAG